MVRCSVRSCCDRSVERLPALCKHTWRGTGVTEQGAAGLAGMAGHQNGSTGANTPSPAAPAPRPSFSTGLDLDFVSWPWWSILLNQHTTNCTNDGEQK